MIRDPFRAVILVLLVLAGKFLDYSLFEFVHEQFQATEISNVLMLFITELVNIMYKEDSIVYHRDMSSLSNEAQSKTHEKSTETIQQT